MKRPSSTITAAGIGGAVATLIMGLIGAFFPDVAARMPPGVEASLATLAAFATGLLWPETILRQRIREEMK